MKHGLALAVAVVRMALQVDAVELRRFLGRPSPSKQMGAPTAAGVAVTMAMPAVKAVGPDVLMGNSTISFRIGQLMKPDSGKLPERSVYMAACVGELQALMADFSETTSATEDRLRELCQAEERAPEHGTTNAYSTCKEFAEHLTAARAEEARADGKDGGYAFMCADRYGRSMRGQKDDRRQAQKTASAAKASESVSVHAESNKKEKLVPEKVAMKTRKGGRSEAAPSAAPPAAPKVPIAPQAEAKEVSEVLAEELAPEKSEPQSSREDGSDMLSTVGLLNKAAAESEDAKHGDEQGKDMDHAEEDMGDGEGGEEDMGDEEEGGEEGMDEMTEGDLGEEGTDEVTDNYFGGEDVFDGDDVGEEGTDDLTFNYLGREDVFDEDDVGLDEAMA
mmetsp:Transcript_47669/g.137215  ORF Transcript_47669/g.137215 Transcript_47669/m.137215 type:complete len:391 (-) Transcript_47669:71-1243(-)